MKKMIFDDLIACGKAAKLRSFELPKKIAFETKVRLEGIGSGFRVCRPRSPLLHVRRA